MSEAAKKPEASATPAGAEAKEVKAEEAKKTKRKKWLPLESNPELMTRYCHELGVAPMFKFFEITGVDESLLGMVPQPVFAVVMCFPISEATEKHRADEAERIAKDGQAGGADSKNVYHTLQTVGNACGTVALLHAVLNNASLLGLAEDKFFAKFLKQTKGLNAAERAAALEANEDIEVQHQALARDEEAKSRPDHAVNANVHFNAFVCVDGVMWELDGRKKTPIAHGRSSAESLLFDAVTVIKVRFMALDPSEIRFNMVALAAGFDD